ncbi:crossover junction endonuclease EME1 [Rhodotorula taiwanensis]|uniref:Crossover junction endonuclease EME1 n=1 Tax=Rhodotorula taiwanensis TaxID=741276 RepID=A0A2S5B788_9BASI|nr:crossover junction endonuclease EME1 [Rhodotorula taiwanensis]
MVDSSDDEIEILSASQKPARPPTLSPVDAFTHASNPAPGLALASSRNRANQNGQGALSKATGQVLHLSDGSDDDDLPAPFRASSRQPAPRDVRYKPDAIDLSTSEDLVAPGNVWSGGAVAGPSRVRGLGGVPVARSISLTGAPSSSETVSGFARNPSARAFTLAACTLHPQPYESPQLQRAHTLALMSEFDHAITSSSSPHAFIAGGSRPLPPHALSSSPAVRAQKNLSSDPFGDLRTPIPAAAPSVSAARAGEPKKAQPAPRAPAIDRDYDPWADILEDSAKKGKPSKSNGAAAKGKRKAADGGAEPRKRSVSAVAPEVDQAGGKRGKTPRLSAEPGATAGMTKTELKRLETADRMKLREANTLRAGDKKVTTAELTMHISGTAFRAANDDIEQDGLDDDTGRKRSKAPRKATKSSPWLEISRDVEKRLKEYACNIEAPDSSSAANVLECEGAVRWTRICDRMWSEDRKMYIPLVGDERIVVEEDSRLIFLSAFDLSQHVADSTLVNHVTTVQSHLPPHVNLFIMLYGLNALARDLERARQEAYRNQVRAASGDDAVGAAKAVKLPGIGEKQPSKDDLELALIRLQMQTRCMLVNVDKVSDAVDWLEQITFDVGQKPYQRLKHSHIAMLGTSEDKVVSGKDLQDTYIKMLASLPRVTEAMAKGIVAEYPTLRKLYESYERCRDEREMKEMLVGIGKGRNLDGTATHRAIGKDMSANIYRVFMGRESFSLRSSMLNAC